jgi:hypothetical protein
LLWHLHVTEQVLRQDDAIELSRVGDDDHGGRVDELMIELELGVLGLEGLGHDFPPEPRGREDVGLVDGVDDKGRVRGEGDLRCDPGDALNLIDTVDHRVPRDVLIRRDTLLLARAKIDASDELADDDEVHVARDVRFERGVGEEGVGGEVGGADVGVQPERLAKREKTLLWPDFAVDTPFWATD